MAQVAQRAANPRVTPARVLRGEPDHEQLNAGSARWSPDPTASRTVVLLGDELAVPAQEGLRVHDAGELLQARQPQRPPLGRQPAALVIGEPQPAGTELLAQHTVLLLEVVNRLELAPMHPPAKNVSKKRNASVPIGWPS